MNFLEWETKNLAFHLAFFLQKKSFNRTLYIHMYKVVYVCIYKYVHMGLNSLRYINTKYTNLFITYSYLIIWIDKEIENNIKNITYFRSYTIFFFAFIVSFLLLFNIHSLKFLLPVPHPLSLTQVWLHFIHYSYHHGAWSEYLGNIVVDEI